MGDDVKKRRKMGDDEQIMENGRRGPEEVYGMWKIFFSHENDNFR